MMATDGDGFFTQPSVPRTSLAYYVYFSGLAGRWNFVVDVLFPSRTTDICVNLKMTTGK